MFRAALGALLSFAVLGCTGLELSPTNPADVNLSGEWVVDFGDSDEVPDMRQLHHPPRKQSRSSKPSVRSEAQRIGDGSGFTFIAHDFQVLRADKIRIEQNRDSMGIRYYPGIYRDITWGERQRGLWEVYAGWQGRDLVIVSQAPDLKVQERLSKTGPNRLIVRISIEADGQEVDYQRAFNRRQ